MNEIVLSQEQQDIINEILEPTTDVLSIQAKAGASKSYTMIQAAKALYEKDRNVKIRYLVFGRLAADEAKTEFGHTAIVSNIHQLAYKYTISESNMHLLSKPFATWRDIPNKIYQPYGKTFLALMITTDFFKSDYLSFSKFMENLHYKADKETVTLAREIIAAMFDGSMGCTHDAYLKLFHSGVVNGSIKLDPVDVLMIDEANDLNKITLDLFKHYPAKLKILVGDQNQRIFSFMGCINAFEEFPNAKVLPLSKSFRCSVNIAKKIQEFGKIFFDDNFVFEGFEYPDNPEIKSYAYISRTNAELIDKILQLKDTKTPFKLATKNKAKQMFEVPLAVLRCKQGNEEKGLRFKDLQEYVDKYYSSFQLQEMYKSRFAYLLEKMEDDPEIISSIKLIMKYGPKVIIDVYNEIVHERHDSANLTLITAHTSKGLSIDSIEISDGLNDAVSDLIYNIIYEDYEPTEDDMAELNLYYVAISRARYEVKNAVFIEDRFLNQIKEIRNEK